MMSFKIRLSYATIKRSVLIAFFSVDSKLVDKYGDQLKSYADELEQIERGMQEIHKDLI